MRMFLVTILTLAALPAHAAPLPEPLTCLLRPEKSSRIGADTGGIVASVAVERAEHVEKGDLLVQLDDRIAVAEYDKARIANDIAQEKLGRAEGLTAGRVISTEEIATIRAEAATAAVDLKRSELQVARARITAPFAGTVAEITTEAGQLISSEPLLTLIDTSRLRAEIVFPAEAFGRIGPGDVLTLGVELVGGEVEGRVATIDNYLDATSNSFSVIAEIDNEDGAIPAGTSCVLVQ